MTTTRSSRPEVERWDVIVFGSGPAGSALARNMATRHAVLLLERTTPSVYLRHCMAWRIGESLPGAAAVLLRRQGLFERFLADGHVDRGASVSVWSRADPQWFDSLRDPNGPGWHLDRVRFDAMLRDAAHEAGAAFAPLHGRFQVFRADGEWRVIDDASGQQYSAAVLVDATGRSAALSRSMGLQRYAADRLVCAHVMLPPSQDLDRCTRTCADTGGWWYSVRGPSGLRVLAFHLDADDPTLRELRDANTLLARARRLPLLNEVLPDTMESMKTNVRPAGSATLDLRNCARQLGVYAVGDALLTFDPIASQGLFHALASAESAAAAITQYLDGNTNAGHAYFTEMQNVQSRYLAHLSATYAEPNRYSDYPFWARRCRPHQLLQKLGHGPPPISGHLTV